MKTINGKQIDDKFFLEGVPLVLDPGLSWLPIESPNQSPQGIVIHHTCGYKMSGDKDWFMKDGVSIHILIGREEGEIIQMAPLNMRCAHAGSSQWDVNSDGHIDDTEKDLNRRFIGIEFTSLGPLTKQGSKFIDCWGREYTGKVQERVIAGYRYWAEWSDWQNRMLKEIPLRIISQINTIDYTDIVGHYEVSPNRKNDPAGGPNITMPELRNYLKENLKIPIVKKESVHLVNKMDALSLLNRLKQDDIKNDHYVYVINGSVGSCIHCGVNIPQKGNRICDKCHSTCNIYV